MEGSIASQKSANDPVARVDRNVAAHAIEMARPLIEQAMTDRQYGDSGFLHVVVMDPSRSPSDSSFDESVLLEHSFGDRSRWDADYAAFARAKAQTSWITGADNPKGAVCIDGLVVGASGAFERFDQAYSGVVAMCARALAAESRS
jgi:hypothetical protein